jgi:hypothetical protein
MRVKAALGVGSDANFTAAGLAPCLARCYLAVMRHVLRRLCILVLSLSMMAGAGVQYAAAAGMGAKTGATASAVSSGSMSDGCGGCTQDAAKMSPGVCAAFCSAMVAVLPPVVSPFGASLIWMPATRVRHFAGKNIPPDPYPPRPTILR